MTPTTTSTSEVASREEEVQTKRIVCAACSQQCGLLAGVRVDGSSDGCGAIGSTLAPSSHVPEGLPSLRPAE